MSARLFVRRAAAAFATAALLATSTAVMAAATIVIVNADGAGEGFNDPTPAAPIGGNAGITLGQQRLNAFQHAASIWGATLTSVATIRVEANFDPLSCNANSAVLGSAGAINAVGNFPNAPFANTWYGEALANKIAGVDLLPADPEIGATFNANLGAAGCLTGVFFYLGLDNNHGANIDLVTVLLHEFGHGLNFQNFTNGNTGAFYAGFPSVWDHFMVDNTTNLMWVDMTNAQRQASAINARRVAWTGANVTNAVPQVLALGTPQLVVTGSLAVNGTYDVGAASFGPQLASPGVSGDIMPVLTQPAETGPGCDPYNALNALAVNGNIALVNRGICGFTVKVKNAQNAGAIAVIIADNVAGSPPAGLGGSDPTITIPSVRITLADANLIRTALLFRSRTNSGVIGNLGVDLSRRAGADAFGRALMFTPNPFQPGSSVSHWDTSTFPNQLMEPAINADLTHSVNVPQDLTFRLLQDIGW